MKNFNLLIEEYMENDISKWKKYITKVTGTGKKQTSTINELNFEWNYIKEKEQDKVPEEITSFSHLIEKVFHKMKQDKIALDYDDVFQLLITGKNSYCKFNWAGQTNDIHSSIIAFVEYTYLTLEKTAIKIVSAPLNLEDIKKGLMDGSLIFPSESFLKGSLPPIMDDGTDLSEVYHKFNGLYFSNELPPVVIRFNDIGKKTVGMAHSKEYKNYYILPYGISLAKEFKHYISKDQKRYCYETLLHEMCHVYMNMKFLILAESNKHDPHKSPVFRDKLKEISVKTGYDFGQMYAYHLTIADVEKYDVNMKNQNGRTKLMIAVSEGDEAVVKRLLKHEEIRVNEKDDIGRTALATACDYGFVNMVEILLSHAGINVNVTDAGGYSPLLRACMREKTNTVNVIEALLKHPDIEVNHKAKDGTTALKMISRPYDGFFMDEVTVKKMNEMKAVIKDMLIKRGAKE